MQRAQCVLRQRVFTQGNPLQIIRMGKRSRSLHDSWALPLPGKLTLGICKKRNQKILRLHR